MPINNTELNPVVETLIQRIKAAQWQLGILPFSRDAIRDEMSEVSEEEFFLAWHAAIILNKDRPGW